MSGPAVREALRITLVAGEFPYPPNHGGRADMWTRIVGLAESGVEIQLICWTSEFWSGQAQPEHIEAVRRVVRDLIVQHIPLGPVALLRRLMLLPRWPSFVASRAPTQEQWSELWPRVQAFAPQGIWQDNLWGGALAERLAQALGVPRWVRSHNIEFLYMRRQQALTQGWRQRLKQWLNCVGIERYELHNLRSAQAVFDISTDDLAYWRSRGVPHGHWLPPIVRVPSPQAQADAQVHALPAGSALYVGNLHTPNNVQGLLWFLNQVWPQVRKELPDAQVTLAGASPHPAVQEAVAASEGVTLLPNPPDVWPLYRQAAVLVNPVLAGSGVNVKTTEMLQLGVPIVCTPVGAGGLTPEVRAALLIAKAPEQFAQALCQALRGGAAVPEAVSKKAQRQFQPDALDAVIALLRRDARTKSAVQ
jgi:polysaccharide biosynthesis protein PslH